MKEHIINYQNIQTNNLKGFDLNITIGESIGVSGCSGSGKSSLVYGTLHAIAEYEQSKVSSSVGCQDYSFKVGAYNHVIPSVVLTQQNFNTNPRSTVSSFLGVDKLLRFLFAKSSHFPPSFFSYNSPHGFCPRCSGTGRELKLNEELLLHRAKSLADNPFPHWKDDFHYQLMLAFARGCSIPTDVPFYKLTKTTKNTLLYGSSSEKIRVSYKLGGRKRTSLSFYKGVFTDAYDLFEDAKHISSRHSIEPYCSEMECSICNGSRLRPEATSVTYHGISLSDIYTKPAVEIASFFQDILSSCHDEKEIFLAHRIHQLLRVLNEIGIAYLNLGRGIPTLSGGELQRLRIANILSSQLTGVMYAIDEPSSGLHISEYQAVCSALISLKDRGNTLVMIEHNPYFLQKMDRLIFVGPKSGNEGGELVSTCEVAPHSRTTYQRIECNHYIDFVPITLHNVFAAKVRIPQQGLTLVIGPSGSGKSSLVQECAKQLPKALYVTQKPLRGANSSTIASYSGALSLIRKLYAKHFHQPEVYFSFASTEGQCPTCQGKGHIHMLTDFGKSEFTSLCDDCQGKRFSKEALEKKINNCSIYDILSLPINHLVKLNIIQGEKQLVRILNGLIQLGLGYLSLFRTTDTLSGGESQRLKLSKLIQTEGKDVAYILDEPLKGLSHIDVERILCYIKSIANLQSAPLILIEHNPLAISASDYIIEMGPGRGPDGGKVVFQGNINTFLASNNYNAYLPYVE